VARTVGWVAQWKEMAEEPLQKISRPRQVSCAAHLCWHKRPFLFLDGLHFEQLNFQLQFEQSMHVSMEVLIPKVSRQYCDGMWKVAHSGSVVHNLAQGVTHTWPVQTMLSTYCGDCYNTNIGMSLLLGEVTCQACQHCCYSSPCCRCQRQSPRPSITASECCKQMPRKSIFCFAWC